jgi:hypothetical protein
LPQLVEGGLSALEQGATVDRRLDPARIAIKQLHAEHLLEAGDNVRNGWLAQSELVCGSGHAARLHDGKKNLQVPELQAAADLVLGDFRHRKFLYG